MGEAQQFFAWIRGSFDGIEKDYDRKRTPSIIWVGVTRESMLAYHRALAGKIAWYEERIEKVRKQRGAGLTPAPSPAYSPHPHDENRRSLDDSGSLDNPGESQPCGRRCRPNWNAHSDGLRSNTAQDARERSNPERHPRSSGGMVKHDAEHQGYAGASLTRSRGRRDLWRDDDA